MSHPPPGPTHAAVKVARNALETVIVSLREIPLDFDRDAVATRRESTMELLYSALDSGVESIAHHDGVNEGWRAAAEARAMLAGVGVAPAVGRSLAILDNAIRQLASASETLAELQLEQRLLLRGRAEADEEPRPRPFRTSIGTPQLHALARPPVRARLSTAPIVDIPSQEPVAPPTAIPAPTTLEELKAFAAAAASGDLERQLTEEPPEKEKPSPPAPPEYAYVPAVEEGQAMRDLARDCLEDIANLSTLRHPIPTETWLDQGPFEQRLLDNLDSFAALGGVGLPLVSLFHAESETPDPARAFAAAFTLGCIDGTDAAYTAASIAKESAPEELPGFIEGWSLAPSDDIDEALADLLGHPKAHLAGLAVDVLGRRGKLPADAVSWILSRGDAALNVKVARALASNLERSEVVAVLEPFARHGARDDDLFLAAAESLLRRGHGRTRDVLRDTLDEPAASPARREGAAWLLCLAGRPDQAQALLDHARREPAPRVVRGLGRFGHAEAIPLLIDLLRSDVGATVEAAAESLERITGAGLRTTVEEPWEVALPPEARAMEDEGLIPRPMRKVDKVIVDPAVWQHWLDREGRRFDSPKKWRGGVAFSPVHIVDELLAAQTPPARREEAALELWIATGIVSSFRHDDWVARQKTMLSELRERVAGLDIEAGSFCFAGAARALDVGGG